MRHWTPEERARQAEKIRGWQPWKKAGVKAGRVRSCHNALKHGGYTQEMFELRGYLRDARALLQALGTLRDGRAASKTIEKTRLEPEEGATTETTNSQNELL